jgi:5-formyltetrahydrofolate cyclo-ligase
VNETSILKTTLRKQFREAIANVSVTDRDRAAGRVFDRIRRHPEWRSAKTVMLFVPLEDEINILPLLNEAIHHHKTLVLPRFNKITESYEPAVVGNLAGHLKTGLYGVSEPTSDCHLCPVNRLDVTVVPGLGFDGEGRRLGRGKGFYDRLLADASGLLWGVGHDVQLTDRLPVESHDVVMNCIVTPSRWLDVRPVRG